MILPLKRSLAGLGARPVYQRKMTNGYHAMRAAAGEADIRTVVDTARLRGSTPFGTILKTVSA